MLVVQNTIDNSDYVRYSQLQVTYSNEVLSTSLTKAIDTYSFFIKIWDTGLIYIQEQVYVLFLNAKNEVISWRCTNTGTAIETLFDIKFVLSCALVTMAAKVIIAHNHPSGVLQPSPGDIAITKKFKAACDLVDIELLDHLIISDKGHFSFKQNAVKF
jgi:DNA repair protein RadC